MRYMPLVAWYLCLVGLALSLATLLSGIPGNHPNAPAMATYNVSSLGLVDYHDPSSLLFQNISALVPSTISNPPSITKYLGVKDWYTIHYYTTCSGFFAPSTSNPSLLSTTKINTTCMLQGSGNVFSLGSTLEKEIKPSVRLLADEVASKVKSYNISPPINLWLTGISTCFVIILNLPCSFSGRWRHANSRNFVVAVITLLLFAISSGLVTGHALEIHRSQAPIGPNPYPGAFLSLTWTTTVCLVLVCCLLLLECRYEIWTPAGEPITTYRKPRDAGWFTISPTKSAELNKNGDSWR